MTNSEIVIKFNSRVLSGIVLEIKETVCVCVCVCVCVLSRFSHVLLFVTP